MRYGTTLLQLVVVHEFLCGFILLTFWKVGNYWHRASLEVALLLNSPLSTVFGFDPWQSISLCGAKFFLGGGGFITVCLCLLFTSGVKTAECECEVFRSSVLQMCALKKAASASCTKNTHPVSAHHTIQSIFSCTDTHWNHLCAVRLQSTLILLPLGLCLLWHFRNFQNHKLHYANRQIT